MLDTLHICETGKDDNNKSLFNFHLQSYELQETITVDNTAEGKYKLDVMVLSGRYAVKKKISYMFKFG